MPFDAAPTTAPAPDTVPPPGPACAGLVLSFQTDDARERKLRAALAGDGLELCACASYREMTALIRDRQPDVLILDWAMPEPIAVCQSLRAGLRRVMPVVVVDWEGGSEDAAIQALDAGADEYFDSPDRPRELRARVVSQLRNKRRLDSITRIRAERDSLRFDVRLDALTGVLNRRALDASLAGFAREDLPFALLFLDLDHFKGINDVYGHAAGDRVLSALGRVLKDQVRPDDVAGRYGGEEFIVLLRGAGLEVAQRVSQRIQIALAELFVEGVPSELTLSIGIAAADAGEGLAPHEIVARADEALYRAKHAGRNRVCVAGAPHTQESSGPNLRRPRGEREALGEARL